MTYAESYAVSQDPAFLLRVRMAILDAAIDVMTESTGLAGHALRASLAAQVLSYTTDWTVRFAEAVVAHDPALTIAVSDANLKNAVAARWSPMAGFDPS